MINFVVASFARPQPIWPDTVLWILGVNIVLFIICLFATDRPIAKVLAHLVITAIFLSTDQHASLRVAAGILALAAVTIVIYDLSHRKKMKEVEPAH